MSETETPGGATAAPDEAWPTEGHRRQLRTSLENGWIAALAAYDRANARLTARGAEPAPAAADGTAGEAGASAPPDRAVVDRAALDKAVLDDGKLTAAAKAALAGVEAAWRALALAAPADGANRAEARQADAESLAESRRRLSGVAEGREAAGPGPGPGPGHDNCEGHEEEETP